MPEAPVEALVELSMAHCLTRCLHVVADMAVADALDDAPRTAAELAEATGANADALNRVLRLLASHGVFEARDGRWTHTDLSRLLRTDHPQSMRSFVRMIGFPLYWKVWEDLEYTVRTGLSGGDKVTPGGMWRWLGENPEASRIFDEAMTGKAHGQIAGVVASYDFSPFRTIADIGGGRGHLLQAVLAKALQANGVLFDLPHVVEQAAGIASHRLRLQGGDFFTDALPTADAYLIMQVIHDWSDREAARILSAIRRAAAPGAKLLLIEAIIPDDARPSWIRLLDVHMMTLLTGRERTEAEFRELLRRAGFRLDRTIEIGLKTSILESEAV
jgi:hypothetical protein